MKRLIKRLLRENIGFLVETMIPVDNEPHEHGELNYIAIAQDDKTNDFLLLWVELHKEDDGFTYSYFFNVMDENGNQKTKRLYNRGETANYLPQDIKSRIIPLVKQMTINLVNRINPNIINRKAVEFLTQKAMKRYDEISQLLQDELGYTLIKQGKNEEGKQAWKFQKNGKEHELNEDTIGFFYTFNEERWRKNMEKANIKLMESIRPVWAEHRRIDEERRLIRPKNDDNI